MPVSKNIYEKIMSYKNNAQDVVRRELLKELQNETQNDVIIYASTFNPKFSGINVPAIDHDDIQGFMQCLNGLKSKKLDLIIHSPGGSLEATEQIVMYLRSKYDYIRAFIPQSAMSAATMLACACDEIVMGKHSAIGPIDPQMIIPPYVLPAHSILAEFKQAKEEILKDANTAKVWIPKLLKIPQGYLDLCQKTIDNSKLKVAEWLDKYMFKNEKNKKGKEIAEWLGNFELHNTHGRPINYELANEHGLKISLLEDSQMLQDKVLSVFHAAAITFQVSSCVKLIENHLGNGSYVVVQGNFIR